MSIGTTFISYLVCFIFCRYYKNSIEEVPGWNPDIINWCRKEAERRKLKEKDYWGGFVIDEMNVQVIKFVFYELKENVGLLTKQ